VRLALLGKNIGIYSLGNIALRAASFLLIPIYTRYLSVANYGLLDICIVTMQILIIFMSLGMPQSLVRFYREHEIKVETGSLFVSSLTINMIGCLILSVVILLFRNPLSRIIFSQDLSTILVLVCFVSLARSLTQTSLSYFRAKNQAFMYSVIAVVVMLGLMTLNIIFVIVLRKGIVGILQSYLIVYGLAAVIVSILIISKSRPKISPGVTKKLLVFGLPLIFSMSGWFIIQMSSRYFLANSSGLNEVGIYGLGYRIVTILQIVIVMPFQLAFGPFIFSQEKYPELGAKISKILTYMLMLLFASTWMTGFLAKLIIKIMAPSEYQQSHMVVLFMLPSIIAIGVYYWAASLLHLKKKTQWIGIFIASSAVINVLLNLWLIPKYGWYGAAISTNLSIFLAMTLILLFSQKFFRVTFEKQRLIRLVFSFISLCAVLIISLRFRDPVYYVVNGIAFIMTAILLYNSQFLSEKEKSLINRRTKDPDA
jgi:O-antigen/teichoic acid export membrane protein